MIKSMLICPVAAMCVVLSAADTDTDAVVTHEILTLEKQVMDGWKMGNPDPALAISDTAITYIHDMTNGRLDGLPAVKALYEGFRGRPLFDSYEIVNPKVQVSGDLAILTYLFIRHNGSAASRWNATQVYQRKKEGWRIIHTHWSMIRES